MSSVLSCQLISLPNMMSGDLQSTLTVVLINRCHMRQDLGSIDTSPIEGIVREDIDIVPADLSSLAQF